jgi:hypothetical protein
MLPIFAATKREKRSDISQILKTLQQWHQMKEIIIGRIIDPAFYGYRVVYCTIRMSLKIRKLFLP